ncbi:diguanylate cyclase, putative [Oceanicola granulosus HTCC2516]|uniref:Diguanylate cyclase, putative n=1 Tax=Oceanicola granulosus (strain ATCC BAA-861 / DSM 15982 / KCTC 12143 / HTCC2516) TaxID=314256 RepID=Q2CI03_OCEGH|nr:bifunctional diguanylate cyclase/phosphodiesterase [Oceanicola granulosus]EAR52455.1 diguanylate cyclase, putative [Oceanicola granulosus HTCC2516]
MADRPLLIRTRIALVAALMAIAAWLVLQQPALLAAAFLLPAMLAIGSDGRLRAQEADALTGLLRHDGLCRVLDAEDGAHTRGALVLEMDGWQALEERLERAELDRLLAVLGQRLRLAVRGGDHCARFEGPTFAVGLPPSPDLGAAAAERLARRVQEVLAQPLRLGDDAFRPSLSLGLALSCDGARADAAALLQAARLAQIEAARAGPGEVRRYGPNMQERVARREVMVRDLSRALAAGEIGVQFQPQIELASDAVTGFEALARWTSAELGPVPPPEFLAAARQAGLVERLGQTILDEALRALAGWDAVGLPVPAVAVNLSAEELRDPGLVDRVAFTLARHDLAPGRLTIEVLETVVSEPDGAAAETLHALARLGCRIDLDDFGTGHASITSIRRFPVDRIKIDRSFVASVDTEIEQRGMMEAILTMADRLGLDTLAEGVETPEELAALRELGCRQAQGFLIARPMPAEAARAWLESRPEARREVRRRRTG